MSQRNQVKDDTPQSCDHDNPSLQRLSFSQMNSNYQQSSFTQSILSPIAEHGVKISNFQNEDQEEKHDKSGSIEDDDDYYSEEYDDVDQFQLKEIVVPKPYVVPQKNIMVVTAQGGIDLDDVFDFERKENSQSRLTIAKRFSKILGSYQFDADEGTDLYQSLPKWFAYYILGQSVFIGSIMVPWISLIPSDKMLRISWRAMLQAIMLIPFVLYEFRNVPEKFQNCYNFKYIFQTRQFSKLFIASLNMGSQGAVQTYCFGWTHMSNVVLFISMTNFWLSVVRAYKSENCHFVESGGRYMCFIGVLIIWFDSYTFDPEPYIPFIDGYVNNAVLYREPWQRCLIGNSLPLIWAFSFSQLAKFTVEIKNFYPPFFSLFAINFMASIHLWLYSYFIDGTSVNNDPFWGLFGFTQDGSFTLFMYLSLLLSLGFFSSSIFISKLFEPVIPASSAVFEPLFCTYINQAIGVQQMPTAISGMGYLLIAPGQFLIIIGQHFALKEKEYQDKLIVPPLIEIPKSYNETPRNAAIKAKRNSIINPHPSTDTPKFRPSLKGMISQTFHQTDMDPQKIRNQRKVSFTAGM